MISIILMDQDVQFGALLKQLIPNSREMCLVGEAHTGGQGIDLIKKHSAKESLVVLLNTQLPDRLGESVCRYIHRHWPIVACIFLMNQVHWPTLSRLVTLPAKGFVSKQACYLSLEAIRVVQSGRTYLQPDLALELLHYRAHPVIPQLDSLSLREYEVLMMLAKDKSYEEIADVVHISIKTAYNLRVSACQKLKIKTPKEISEVMFSAGQFKTYY